MAQLFLKLRTREIEMMKQLGQLGYFILVVFIANEIILHRI